MERKCIYFLSTRATPKLWHISNQELHAYEVDVGQAAATGSLSVFWLWSLSGMGLRTPVFQDMTGGPLSVQEGLLKG